jgi:hypothetical protein
MKTEAIIDTFINGNLTDARNRAKRISAKKFINTAIQMGYPMARSILIAAYLKGVISFDQYCNTKTSEL